MFFITIAVQVLLHMQTRNMSTTYPVLDCLELWTSVWTFTSVSNRGHDKILTSFMIFLVEEEILFLGRSTRQPSICKTFCFLTLWASEAIISQIPIFKEKIIFSHILWNFLQMQLAKPVKTVQLFARYTIIEINSHYCLANVSWRPLWLLTCW